MKSKITSTKTIYKRKWTHFSYYKFKCKDMWMCNDWLQIICWLIALVFGYNQIIVSIFTHLSDSRCLFTDIESVYYGQLESTVSAKCSQHFNLLPSESTGFRVIRHWFRWLCFEIRDSKRNMWAMYPNIARMSA